MVDHGVIVCVVFFDMLLKVKTVKCLHHKLAAQEYGTSMSCTLCVLCVEFEQIILSRGPMGIET
jgi:hypothetical protein